MSEVNLRPKGNGNRMSGGPLGVERRLSLILTASKVTFCQTHHNEERPRDVSYQPNETQTQNNETQPRGGLRAASSYSKEIHQEGISVASP